MSEAQLAAARQHGDNNALAEALLDRAVIHSLQEETRAAFEAQQAFEKAQDNVGSANCLMTAGDWLGAPSSSSLVWNLILQASSSEASELAINTEAAEFLRPDKDALAQAADRYRRAVELYAKAEAPRGIASIGLRHGYSRCSTTITRRRLRTLSARKNILYARVVCGKRICFPLLRLNSTARL